MTRGRLTLKFCKWFENTRFKIPRQRDELHLSDNPTGTVLADLVGDNSVGTTRVPVIGTTRGHPPPIQSAPFRDVKLQNALFRRVRFFSPAQTRRRLTEKRILRVGPHGKAHFGRAPGARLTKRRTLAVLELAECAFP